MSDQSFVNHLQRLAERNRGALAELRHSLTYAPGTTPRVFPYVESFIASDEFPASALRQAYYLVAGLYALHPQQRGVTLAKAMGILYHRQQQSQSIERRFIALLESHACTLAEPLRHCVTLLRAHELAIDYRALLSDLTIWLNPARPDPLNKLRRRWASDFYRAAVTTDASRPLNLKEEHHDPVC